MATGAGSSDDATRIRLECAALACLAEECIAGGATLEVWRRRAQVVLGVIGTSLPIEGYGRRPKFFADVDVRERLVALHREVSIKEALALLTDQFGRDRTPSRSAISRFWIYLDRLNRRASR